jgi:molybdopterin converting factor small subunit
LVIKVKLMGSLTKLAGKSEVCLKANRSIALSEVIRKICRKISSPEFEKAIIDPNSKAVGSHIIVLINDRDTSVLQGPETRVRSNDEITFIPITHGG